MLSLTEKLIGIFSCPRLRSEEDCLIAIRSKHNEWVERCCRKLQAISRLEANWDSYGAAPPDTVSFGYAKAFLGFLGDKVGVLEPAITANASGNVCFEWDQESFSLLVEIDAAGRCHYHYETQDGEKSDAVADFTPLLAMVTHL